MRDKLTLKQERFINAYLIDGNATKAAKKAGYKGNYQTLQQVSSENLTKPLIIAAIKAIRAKTEGKVVITVNHVLNNIERHRIMAEEKKDLSAAIACDTLEGKHLAMFTDVTSTDQTRQAELDRAAQDEAAQLARIRLADKYHISVS